ncbi:Fc.00g103460.m01.CDS01 [Cosmosporella sp. VM-42]
MSREQLACPAGVDDSFGPWAEGCRGGFDFTLLFEESILTIPLQCLFLLVLPIRVTQLVKTNTKVIPSYQRLLKISTCICLVALNASLVACTSNGSTGQAHTRATIPTATLVFVTSLGLCLLSWLEHQRTLRPSFVLTTYLCLSVLFDTARARTLWMLGSSPTTQAIFTCTLALRAVLLVLESTEKRSILISDHTGCSKEATSGTLNRGVFFWLTPLFLKGHKNILTLEDLYPLDEKLRSEHLHKTLTDAWDKVPDKTVPGALFGTWHRAFVRSIMFAVIPRLFVIAFTYAQPFLINAAIKFAGLPESQPYDNFGYGLIGAYFLVYTGIAVSTGQYEWCVHRTATVMRGSIVGLIYEKALSLDVTSPSVSPEGALTLVGTDTGTITAGVIVLHDTWAGLLEIGLAIYLIQRELGAASAMPIAVAFVVMIGIGFIAVPTGKAAAAWNQASQNRVTATSKTLGNIKWLTVSGLNEKAFDMIRTLRSRELQISRRYRVFLGVCLALLICTPIWSPILTFIVYGGIAANSDGLLTISKAFTSLALIGLLAKPLSDITLALPSLAGSVTSFQRIQDYLNAKEWDDKRPTALEEKNGKLETRGLGDLSNGLDCELTELRKGSEAAAGLEKDMIASVQGKLSWGEDQEPVIDINHWTIRRRAFTLILGPVGCGKSTLLKSLLGELSAFEGVIRRAYSGVAYCGQNPWLPNETIRDVIVGGKSFDPLWYSTVISACALEHDLQSLPKGDETMAGTRGISMSGGQKQRLAIARAVYSRRELILFDDVLSGLDSATEEVVFENLFGGQGLLRSADTTIIITSSDVRHASYADQVVLLNDKGQIRHQGGPEGLNQVLGLSETETRWNRRDKAEATQSPFDSQRAVAVVANMEVQADASRRVGDSTMYSFYARAAGWFTIISFFFSMAVFAFCHSFPDIWLKWWAESNLKHPNSDLGKWLGGFAGFGAGSTIAVLVATWLLLIVIINKSGVYFHDLLLETTSRAPISFHSTVDSGVTVNRFSQDLHLIDNELPGAALGVAVGISFAVASFIMISVSSKYLAIILPFLLIVFYAVSHFYLHTSRQMRLLDIEQKAPLYTQLIETLDGLTTIRAFQWEERFFKNTIALLDDSQRPHYLLFCLQRWLNFAVDMMIMLISLILIILTTTVREEVGPGFMGVASTNILAFSGTVKAAITSWVLLEVSLGAVARVKHFTSVTTREEHVEVSPAVQNRKDWPEHGVIEFRGVTATYGSSANILNDVTFSVEAGQRIAVCGRTGSGKSSLMLCLLSMMQTSAGAITIDGVDLSPLSREYVCSRLVAVPQESCIFDETVRFNVDPFEAVSDEAIVLALERVQLWGRIQARGGLDAPMDDKFLSQGEARLLILARAMVRKSRVLILDEITSGLDEETSAIVDEVLRSWFQGWTIIAIMHKFNSILDFDKVAVLDSGSLLEFDAPGRLLERDSTFRMLYHLYSQGRA